MLHHVTLFGHTINLYDFINTFDVFGEIIVALLFANQFREAASTLPSWLNMKLNRKKKNVSFWQNFFILLVAVPFFTIAPRINNVAGKSISLLFLGDTSANFFPNIFVSPITLFLLSLLLLISPLKLLDISSLTTATVLIWLLLWCRMEKRYVEYQNGTDGIPCAACGNRLCGCDACRADVFAAKQKDANETRSRLSAFYVDVLRFQIRFGILAR